MVTLPSLLDKLGEAKCGNRRKITCSWCGDIVIPKAPRMRLFESESIRVTGNWLAHFHPECGDALLDYCEVRQAEVVAVVRRAAERAGEQ